MMLSDRCSEGFLNGPSTCVNTVEQDTLVYASFSCPLSYGHCPATEGEEMVAPSIIGLLNFGSPLAVLRRVRAVIVGTFDGMLEIRLWPHAGVKGGKVVPSWVNSNTALTVEVVSWAVGIVASLVYISPCAMLWGVCHAMQYVQLRCYFLAQAAAALSTMCMKTIAYYSGLIPAVTLAEPHNTPASIWGTFNDNQPSVSYSNPVNQFRHFVLSKMKAALGRCKMLSRNLRQGAAAFHFMIAPYKLRDKCILA